TGVKDAKRHRDGQPGRNRKDRLMRSTPQISRSDEAEVAGYAAEGAIRAVEVAPLVLIGLLVCPPLAILVVVVVVPLLLVALVVCLLAAVVPTPYVRAHALRGPRRFG